MHAAEWSALAEMLLSVSAAVGGGWALYTFSRARRTDAARWITDTFNAMYRDPELIKAREVFEYSYWDSVRQTVELRVTDRHIEIPSESRETLRAIDLILNYFEQLIYLQQEKHISSRDREVFFAYWMGILAYPSRAGLRRYLSCCGYERCATLVYEQMGHSELATACEVCALPPEITPCVKLKPIAQGSLPLLADQQVAAFDPDMDLHAWSLYELNDMGDLRALDDQFGYQALGDSRAQRVCLPCVDQIRDVWVYLGAESVEMLPVVLPEAGGGYRKS